MADNVFGNPITNATLQGMPEYAGMQIRRLDRARVALNMKNAGEKAFNARTYVETLKEQYGNGVSTLCLVYNATGDTIRYAYGNDWFGHVWRAPYPPLIANGQWGAFLHVKARAAATGSTAAVVYRGQNNDDVEYDWLLSWSNPWNRIRWDNTVITEIRDVNYFESYWRVIYDQLAGGQLHSEARSRGCVSIMSTGSNTSPIVEAILTLENA